MNIAFKTWLGYISLQSDGSIQFRDEIGPWETFEMVNLDPPITPPVPPKPPEEPYPTKPANMSDQDFFMSLVAGKPFGQQTLLNLEPALNYNEWQLTPPNAVGDRTKVHPKGAERWYRVGFGEGHWVWIPQSN